MIKGKFVTINGRDRKKLKELVEFHGFEKLASAIGCYSGTLKKWMDKDLESRFRDGARPKIKSLHAAMLRAPEKSEPELVDVDLVFEDSPLSEIRETVHEGPSTLNELVEMRDAIDTVIKLLGGE